MCSESLAHAVHTLSLCRLVREVVKFVRIGAEVVEQFSAVLLPDDVAEGIRAHAVAGQLRVRSHHCADGNLAALGGGDSPLRGRIAATGAALMLTGPAPLAARLAREIPQWAAVVQQAGIKPE